MDSILLIDDSDDFRETVRDFLVESGFAVWEASCPEDAFNMLQRDNFEVILCDLHMPFTMGKKFFEYQYSYEVGLRTIEELEWVFPHTPIIAMSSMPRDGIKKARERLNGVPLLPKPFKLDELIAVIREMRTNDVHNFVQ